MCGNRIVGYLQLVPEPPMEVRDLVALQLRTVALKLLIQPHMGVEHSLVSLVVLLTDSFQRSGDSVLELYACFEVFKCLIQVGEKASIGFSLLSHQFN